MKVCLRVRDYIKSGMTDSDAIEMCMKDASKIETSKSILFDGGDFYIDRAILISDNTDIIVDECAIIQKDEVFDNLFRGENVVIDKNNPYGKPLDVKPQKNIRIIGKNGAQIVGTSKPRIGFHPFFNEKHIMNGDFWGWRTHMFSFSFGANIEISGFKLRKTMGWAICFDYCHDIYVHDLEIYSDVKNGDGIDFRSGCHDCVVENISGYTSDDTVACTALATDKTSNAPSKYLYPSEPFGSLKLDYNRDIYNIKIKNILTGGLHHGVICLAARGNKVYNVSIENICETSEGGREATVKIYTGYGDGYNAGDIHDITVKNITSQKAKYAVMVVADVENVSFENIVQNNPDGELTFGAQEQYFVTVV